MNDTLQQDATAQRLATEEIAWLTTVSEKGQPQSSPVWFLWDGHAFWLRSQEQAGKVRNIKVNPRVALHLSDDGHGGQVVTVDGIAEFADPPESLLDRYLTKYAEGIRTLQVTPEELAADYSRTIRVTPARARTW